jgi:hypothetical protein
MIALLLACSGPSSSSDLPEQKERLAIGMNVAGTRFGVGGTVSTLPTESKYTVLEAVRSADW